MILIINNSNKEIKNTTWNLKLLYVINALLHNDRATLVNTDDEMNNYILNNKQNINGIILTGSELRICQPQMLDKILDNILPIIELNIPVLGICFGMQMAVIEFARNKLNIKKATSSEFGSSKASVVGLMSEWIKDGKLMKGTDKDLGGTMRLGSYEARLKKGTLISNIYKVSKINERHRHRYEVNINFKEEFEKKGMIFSGLSPNLKLPEIVELKNHPWFIGVQFHPEFKSRPLAPHPLFSSFIKAAKINSKKK